MEPEVTPKPTKAIQIKRNQVTITCNSTPNIFTAQEPITWQGGSVQITGMGATRQDALAALDSEFDLLKKLLGESQS